MARRYAVERRRPDRVQTSDQTNALSPVIALPTISEFISRVPSYE
jgi:hypothetical protein